MSASVTRFALAAAMTIASPSFAAWIQVDAGRGPVAVRLPPGHDPLRPTPLLVLLHGFGASGPLQEAYLQLGPWTDAAGFLYALPDGTVNPLGRRFWNATNACCDTFSSGVDDSSYLRNLIVAIGAAVAVDPHRIFTFGHSNGGFMSYRMACDHADLLAAAASLAGATYDDPLDCTPARPVRVLQIHGTADAAIDYDGGFLLAPYPGALESVATWSVYNGCAAGTESEPPFDAVTDLPGAETEILRFATGCRGPGSELWTIVGGVHSPSFTDEFRARLLAWFVAAGNALLSDGFEAGTTQAWRASPTS